MFPTHRSRIRHLLVGSVAAASVVGAVAFFVVTPSDDSTPVQLTDEATSAPSSPTESTEPSAFDPTRASRQTAHRAAPSESPGIEQAPTSYDSRSPIGTSAPGEAIRESVTSDTLPTVDVSEFEPIERPAPAPEPTPSAGEAALEPQAAAGTEVEAIDDQPVEERAEQPAAAGPTADEPSDEVGEPDAPGTPGTVSPGAEASAVPDASVTGPIVQLTAVDPQPLPSTPPLPVVDITPPPVEQTPPAPSGPGDLAIAPPSGGIGDVTSGLEGCQLACVTSATLTPNLQTPNLAFEVDTTVPTFVAIELVNLDTDHSEYFTPNGFATSWSTMLEPIAPGAPYRLEMIVTDQDGHQQFHTHEFTSSTPATSPGQLAGNEIGCQLQCITVGTVAHTDDYTTVEVHVETETDATLRAWVSTSEPGWIDGDIPLMPQQAEVATPDYEGTGFTFDVTGLQESTTYHIVVAATDGQDATAYRVGQFITDERPPAQVWVTFEQIHVDEDGDASTLNKGELSFSWGFDGAAIGMRAEEKMHSGTTIALGQHNTQLFQLPEDGTLPTIAVAFRERDWDGLWGEFCDIGNGIPAGPTSNDDCDTTTNVAQWAGASLDQIDDLPACSAYGQSGLAGTYRCAMLATPDNGGDYARGRVLVSFQVGAS